MTKLIHNREETKEKIEEQISRAQILLDNNDIELVKKEAGKWTSYTSLLLKGLFTTDEYVDEFQRYRGGAVIINRRQSYQERLSNAKKPILNRITKLESFVERLELLEILDSEASSELVTNSAIDSTSVFIVHGHDEAVKQEVARFLEKVGLTAIILHEQASGSRTIIEKIEDYSNVGYGVVLYTECDVGAQKSSIDNLSNRARQNVVFEHGFLIGKLGRSKVTALVSGDIETPNDISGIIYISMDGHGWKNDLVKELISANMSVDISKLF